MAEELDFYDTVNVRTFGTLENEDGITESVCDAFFSTHRAFKSYKGATVLLDDPLLFLRSGDAEQMTMAIPVNQMMNGSTEVSFIVACLVKAI